MALLKFRVATLLLCLWSILTFSGRLAADASKSGLLPATKADPQLPDFFRFLTEDFEVFVYFNAESLRRANAYPKLRQDVEEKLAEFGRQFQRDTGLEMSEVARLAATFRHGKLDEGVIVIETNRPQNIEDMLKRRKQADAGQESKLDELHRLTIGGCQAYLPKKANGIGVCFPSERTLVYGTNTTLKKVLERDRKTFPTALQSALEREDYTKTLVVIVDTRDPFRAGIQDIDPDKQCQLIQVEAAIGATIDTVVTLDYREAKAAKQFMKLLQDLTQSAIQPESKADALWTALAKAKYDLRDRTLSISTTLTEEHFHRVLSSFKAEKEPGQQPATTTAPAD